MSVEYAREAATVPVIPLHDYSTNPTAGTEYASFFSAQGYNAIRLFIDIDAVGASTSLTYTLQSYDPVTTNKETLLASAAKTSAAPFQMTLGPGLPVTANVSANAVLPRFWAVAVSGTPDGADYVVTAELYDI